MQLQRGQEEDPKTPRELGVQEAGWTGSRRSPHHGPFLVGRRTGPREHPPASPPCQPDSSSIPASPVPRLQAVLINQPLLPFHHPGSVQAAVYLQPFGPAEPGVRSPFQAPQASLGEGPPGVQSHLAVLYSRSCTLGSRLFRPVLCCPLFSLCGIMASPHLDYPEPYLHVLLQKAVCLFPV